MYGYHIIFYCVSFDLFLLIFVYLYHVYITIFADPDSLAVYGVGLGRLVAEIAVSNPAASMDVCLLCLYAVLCCVGRGLCDELIIRPE
jgi:hypothetical protein